MGLRDYAPSIAADHEGVLDRWRAAASSDTATLDGLSQLLHLVVEYLTGPDADGSGQNLRAALADLSSEQARVGTSPTGTAMLVLRLKQALLPTIEAATASDHPRQVAAVLEMNRLVDELSLITFEAFVATREELIRSQSEDLEQLSTPVVRMWDGILAVPLLGVLDSRRALNLSTVLLPAILAERAGAVVIDVTGVAVVDTMVANHLIEISSAVRLLGATCILSGLNPATAIAIVRLGIDLSGIVSFATLADAQAAAFRMLGYTVTRREQGP